MSDEDSKAAVPAKAARRFADDEIRDILGRAAEMQERSAAITPGGAAGGLTLEDLRQVASEAGIDPRFVEMAAADRVAPPQTTVSGLAGGAYSWHYRASVEGEIRDRDRDRILHEIRTVVGGKGELNDVYGRMEWSHDDGTGAVIIGISSRDGQTEIDVSAVKKTEASMIHALGIPFGGVFGGSAVAGLLGLGAATTIPVLAGAGLLSYGATRLGWKLRSQWWERRLKQVVERISEVAGEVAVLPSGESEEGDG